MTCADVDGAHVIDLVAGRDFTPDGTIEAAEARDSDAARTARRDARVRAGHRDRPHFQLGRKYADALGLQALDGNGSWHGHDGLVRRRPSRAVAAIAEGTLDEPPGWPREVAPA